VPSPGPAGPPGGGHGGPSPCRYPPGDGSFRCSPAANDFLNGPWVQASSTALISAIPDAAVSTGKGVLIRQASKREEGGSDGSRSARSSRLAPKWAPAGQQGPVRDRVLPTSRTSRSGRLRARSTPTRWDS
jgi:hypothetical protein